MKPTIGRIVHYVTTFVDSGKTAERPAIITAVVRPAIITAVETDSEEEKVSLTVFHNNAIEHVHGIPNDEGEMPIQTWHWPPRS